MGGVQRPTARPSTVTTTRGAKVPVESRRVACRQVLRLGHLLRCHLPDEHQVALASPADALGSRQDETRVGANEIGWRILREDMAGGVVGLGDAVLGTPEDQHPPRVLKLGHGGVGRLAEHPLDCFEEGTLRPQAATGPGIWVTPLHPKHFGNKALTNGCRYASPGGRQLAVGAPRIPQVGEHLFGVALIGRGGRLSEIASLPRWETFIGVPGARYAPAAARLALALRDLFNLLGLRLGCLAGDFDKGRLVVVEPGDPRRGLGLVRYAVDLYCALDRLAAGRISFSWERQWAPTL